MRTCVDDIMGGIADYICSEAEHFTPQKSALAIFDVATDRDVPTYAALCSRIFREASAELDKMTLS